jgi:predicted dinucleotide-binding enzyme
MKLAIIGSGRVGSAFATVSATRTSQGLRCAARTQRAAPQRTGMTLAQEGASAAEQLAELLPNASVVTAFISISCVLIRTPSSGDKPTVFTCADDENARQRAECHAHGTSQSIDSAQHFLPRLGREGEFVGCHLDPPKQFLPLINIAAG